MSCAVISFVRAASSAVCLRPTPRMACCAVSSLRERSTKACKTLVRADSAIQLAAHVKPDMGFGLDRNGLTDHPSTTRHGLALRHDPFDALGVQPLDRLGNHEI